MNKTLDWFAFCILSIFGVWRLCCSGVQVCNYPSLKRDRIRLYVRCTYIGDGLDGTDIYYMINYREAILDAVNIIFRFCKAFGLSPPIP